MVTSMSRYVAFLRAINVGGRTVKMERLCKLFESMGLSNVETFIASGNVIFETRARSSVALEKTIADRLRTALGYDVGTFIRSVAEVSDIARYQPFPSKDLEAKGSTLYVAFLANTISRTAERKLLTFRTTVDEFRLHGSEIYWLCRVRSSESEFSLALLEKELGVQATFRNSTTVRKIAARYDASAGQRGG
jgi:uncharacterized protein (DUF1697 family)